MTVNEISYKMYSVKNNIKIHLKQSIRDLVSYLMTKIFQNVYNEMIKNFSFLHYFNKRIEWEKIIFQ